MEETLRSVADQLNPREDEIVISDNFSKDNTKKVVEKFRSDFPNIQYYCFENEVEADQNLMKVVSLAKGYYCWLLTDDDIIEPHGVEKVKAVINNQPNLSGMSVRAKAYDKHLQKEKTLRFTFKGAGSTFFLDDKQCLENLGAWLGFWSSQIVRRDYWEEMYNLGGHEKYLGYHHLSILFDIIRKYKNWYFLDEVCIGYRADNETFKQEHGFIKRFEIDAWTYKDILHNQFGKNDFVTKSVLSDVIKYFLFWQLISIKLAKPNLSESFHLFSIATKNLKQCPGYWFRLLPIFLIPTFVLRIIRSIYRRYG